MKNPYAPPQAVADRLASPRDEKKRGIFLSVTLAFQMLLLAGVVIGGVLIPRLKGLPVSLPAQIGAAAIGIFFFSVVAGVWFWKRFAVYLYVAASGASIFFNFIYGQSPALTLATLIIHSFIYFSIFTKWQHFS